MPPIEIEIAYPPAGDDEDIALAYARRLFAVLNEAIESLMLVPADGDDLTVRLNGRLVYSRHATGRPPKVVDVTGALQGDG